ncbi:EGF-like domain-containing protein [Ditylenchus destructor]|nr:EGF-like domain-containing protein [Ditylenchus destructor]
MWLPISFLLLLYSCTFFAHANAVSSSLAYQNSCWAEPDYCGPHGTCMTQRDGSSKCHCHNGWFADRCHRRKCPNYNPCRNNGLCEKLENGNSTYKCHCFPGFEGIHCDTKLTTVCDSNPCQNGRCRLTDSAQDFECDCHYGFTGQTCSEVDYCKGQLCINGDCVNELNGHRCQCYEGWTAADCREDIDECRANPCELGNCVNTPGSYYCDCPLGYTGKHCELKHDPSFCTPNTCLHGGTCDLSTNINTLAVAAGNYKCDCAEGFFGPHCERRVDICMSGQIACINGGVCVNGAPSIGLEAGCKCPAGFTGSSCDVDVDECEKYSGLCLNGASCINKMGTYQCLCVGGFEGDHCEINIDNCKDNLCHSGSSCVDGIARYECLCAPDRIGELCEHSNPCYGENNKCKHGSCSSDPEHGTYTCNCDSGYNGTNCDQDINECEHNPCFDGKCINIEGSFICECKPGYTDPLCMTRINYCHGNPCLNGGTCINDEGRYDCMCLPGYSGVNCETHSYQDLYNCKLPCQNGGICRSSTADRCECPPAYEGIVCEFEKKNPCELNTCHNGSTCIPNFDYGSYYCLCPDNRRGERCELEMQPCEHNPCIHGTCHLNDAIKNATSISCKCDHGFEGDLCDKIIADHCSLMSTSLGQRNPCLNGGYCQNRPDGFECFCKRGFMGELCETPSSGIAKNDKDCRDGFCYNNGLCHQEPDGSDVHKCHCTPGFAGPFCEYDVNECASKPCLNKGRCINLVNDFRCDCAPGYTGERCEYCETFVDVDKFNRTDLVEKDNCHRHSCDSKANNGVCDSECNFYACSFDGGDCTAQLPNIFEHCKQWGPAQQSYCAHVFGDGRCDELCNNEKCLFDGFDCEQRVHRCPHFNYCSQHYANGKCDPQCNITACGWDGGDCDLNTTASLEVPLNVLRGELSLILIVDTTTFPQLLRGFLVTLSGHLRASIRVGVNDAQKPKVYRWRSDTGQGNLLEMDGFDSADLDVVYNETRRTKREVPALEGVIIYLEIDVAMCHVLQHSKDGIFSCFNELESVAAYLGAANAKRSLEDMGVALHRIQVHKPDLPPGPNNNLFYVAVACMVAITLSVVLVSQVLSASRKSKKIKKSKVWIPPLSTAHCKSSIIKNDFCGYQAFQNPMPDCDGNTLTRTWNGPFVPLVEKPYATQVGQPLSHTEHLMNHNFVMYSCSPPNGRTSGHQTVGSCNSSSGVSSEGHSPADNVMWMYSGPHVDHSGHQTVMSCNSSSGVSSGGHSPAENEFNDTIMVLHEQAATGDIPEAVEDNEGATPLIMAIKQGRTAVILHLLSFAHIDPKLADFEDKQPLHHAVALPMPEVVDRLLHLGVDTNALAKRIETPLMRCALTGPRAVPIADQLIQCRADVNLTGDKDAMNCNRRTALHLAALVNNVPMIHLLLKNGANKDATDSEGKTPLILATANLQLAAVQVLVEAEADVTVRDMMDKSALSYAIEHNFEEGRQVLERPPIPSHSSAKFTSDLPFPNMAPPLMYNATGYTTDFSMAAPSAKKARVISTNGNKKNNGVMCF